MSSKLSELGEKINTLMFLKKIKTQRDLARASELNVVHIHKIMSGKIREPDKDTLKKLALALGCEVTELDPTAQSQQETPGTLKELIKLAGENALMSKEINDLKNSLKDTKTSSKIAVEQVTKLKALWGDEGFETILNCRRADVVVALKMISASFATPEFQIQKPDETPLEQKPKTKKSQSR